MAIENSSCSVLSLQVHLLTKEVRLLVTVVNCSISLISMAINSLTILVVIYYKNLWSKSNLILCVLAAVDFVTGGASEPIFMVDFFDVGDQETECMLDNIRIFLSTFLFSMSMCTLALISYDRYLHMALLNNYAHAMTKGKLAAVVAFYTFWSSFIGSIRLVTNVLGRLFAKVLFVGTLVILPAFIGKFYAKIYRINKRSIARVGPKNSRSTTTTEAEEEEEKPKKSHTKLRRKALSNTFFLISLCLVVCWLPMLVFLVVLTVCELIEGSYKDNSIPLNILFLVAWTTGNLKSALNPSIYIYRNRELKYHIKKFCREKILRKQPLPDSFQVGSFVQPSSDMNVVD